MTIKEPDQLGLHLFEAGRQWGSQLNPTTATNLMEDVAASLGPDDFEGKLEFALDLEEVWDEDERHAYKMALGRVYYERMRHTLEMLRIPFAPLND